MQNQTHTEATLSQPRLVRLIRCGRKSCGHVLTEEERGWRQDPKWAAFRTAICPECGGDSFFTLNAAGQAMTARGMRDGPRDIDPAAIEPSPRLGPQMKARVLDAKRRALGILDERNSGDTAGEKTLPAADLIPPPVEPARLLLPLIARVEKNYFRTVSDTGANECAMFVWNQVRQEAGLLPLRLSDLRAWDGTKYVMPPHSRLLENAERPHGQKGLPVGAGQPAMLQTMPAHSGER